MMQARILVADDKVNMRSLFDKLLRDKHAVSFAADGSEALTRVDHESFDLVITDMRMPGASGLDVLKKVKDRAPDTEVIVMTAYAEVSDAVVAMKLGAYDYLQKPFDPDAALMTVERALERKWLRTQTALLQRELEGIHSFGNLLGKSQAMQPVYRLLERAAQLDITVLLQGETGTGKELAARAIHYQSRRRERRFVAVNCGALPADLVESELFGHARGAFTGAVAMKVGLFEEADGGTIFLDEIAELPLTTQVKLNRVLQEKEIRRVGENQPVRVDVRIVTATHRDLRAEVAAGRFREDLFYRLNVLPICLPPLRERREDILLLAEHFLRKHTTQRPEISGFTHEAQQAMLAHTWPGNIRELENAIERAIAIAAGPSVSAADLGLGDSVPGPTGFGTVMTDLPYRQALAVARERFTKEYLAALLKRFGGNVTRAAEHAGIERESLHRLLRKFGARS